MASEQELITLIVALGIAVAGSLILVVAAVELHLASHLVGQLMVGGIVTIMLHLANPPPPATSLVWQVLIWVLAVGLVRVFARFAPAAATRSPSRQEDYGVLEDYFDFEEVTE